MARGGRVSTKHQTGNKVQLKKKGPDESDEDYVVCKDDESEDDYCYRNADDEAEGSLGESEEVNKVGKPTRQRKGGAKGRKKGIQEDYFGGELRMITSYSSAKGKADHHSNEKPRKETNASYQEEGEDSDWNDSDSDEVLLPVMKKKNNKVNRVRVQEDLSAQRKRQKRKLKSLKTTTRKKPKNGCPVKEIKAVAQKTKRGTRNDGGIGKLNAGSDSDAAVYEYTISEEEREQIREGREICKSLTTDLRSSSFLKMIKEEETVPSQQKRPRTKEKEKMVDIKIEVGKHVCGICLSEEGKIRVRGILNCCSHHFCFSCILEWSKVESRCPLCKQRFSTISNPAQVVGDGDHNLRDVIIPVPERDQVYQPSVEELRAYLDPYEDVPCTECHQGGDDALMLLCDLCDSPAHTYCVGLGSEVPEGNWYCVVCRPTELVSSNAQRLPTPHHGENNNLCDGPSPVVSIRETIDHNELYVPETPFSQETLPCASPSYSQTADSPSSGSIALTVNERRRVQQQIHHLILHNRSQQSERSGSMSLSPVSGNSLFGSQLRHLEAVPVRGTRQNIHQQEGRLPYYATISNTRVNTSSIREVRCSSPQKEHVQSMVRSHLKSFSRNSVLGYVSFKKIARGSTHTILAAYRVEHRQNEVYRVETRPLPCRHLHSVASPVAAQCSSCLDWFIRNVVKEIMYTFGFF
ncbi:hypothetical protein C2S53_014325 [Perilla frutescens var. hirtella]|uniref:Uncharacterized protein n=1 Tax=Perilla frutescens var. hirtella TaxID=608512 RepID=A0AAD4J3G9_PERFH|nr:hypothetical protein C2S53_014325 [Perilla frutescens var. hirtella]